MTGKSSIRYSRQFFCQITCSLCQVIFFFGYTDGFLIASARLIMTVSPCCHHEWNLIHGAKATVKYERLSDFLTSAVYNKRTEKATIRIDKSA